MTNAIIFSIIAFILYGIANSLGKIPVEKIGTVKFITSRGIVTSTITFIFALTSFNKGLMIPADLFWGILLAAVSYLGLYFFNMGLAKSKAGIVVPISFSRVIVTTFMGIAFLGEVVKISQLLWMLPIIAGVVLVSLDLKVLKIQDPSIRAGIKYALLSALFWGATIPLFGTFSNRLGLYTYAFIIEFVVLTISLVQSYIKNRNKTQSLLPTTQEFKQNWGIILLVATAGALGSISMNAAYASGFITLVAAITSASPLVSIIIGRLFLREKMTGQQYLGAAIIIIGVIGISIF